MLAVSLQRFPLFTGAQDKSIDLANPPSRLRLLRRNQIATAPPLARSKLVFTNNFSDDEA